MKRLDAEPLVKDVFKNIDSLREKELRKALSMLDEKDEKKRRTSQSQHLDSSRKMLMFPDKGVNGGRGWGE